MKFINEAAGDDLVDAAFNYELDSEGLGERFHQLVKETFTRVKANPRSFPRVHGIAHAEVRKANVPRFPYAVIFYVSHDGPLIVAVAHAKREPLYWETRVDSVDE